MNNSRMENLNYANVIATQQYFLIKMSATKTQHYIY